MIAPVSDMTYDVSSETLIGTQLNSARL